MTDETAFAALVEKHRHELQVHCYRMLGSYQESEDLVQETFLRAWKGIDGFAGRSSVRAWLYRIATNACLDTLDNRTRRVLPQHLSPPGDPRVPSRPRADIPWLEPYPDPVSVDDTEAAVVDRETIELAFLAAIQHLPPRQRAVLILRDVVGWQAKETADLLDSSVPSVNSALQRARETLRKHLPERRSEWSPSAPTEAERTILRRYMDAVERADLTAVAELLAEDVRAVMPPYAFWHQGRESVLAAYADSWDPNSPAYVGRFRMVETRANGRLAIASYLDGAPNAISVVRIENGVIVELTAFHQPALFPAFGLTDEFSGG
jgi:RNA polymerase sigma-70 factor (ECF subfamily)